MAPPAVEVPDVHASHMGVKLLADAGVKVLPSVYIRPKGQRPSDTPFSDEELPILDLSLPRETLLSQVTQICKEWGFFQVINHGVSNTVIDNMFLVAREFHALPIEEKMKHFSEDPRAKMRYGTSFNAKNDKVLNWRDYLRHDCTPFDEMLELVPKNPSLYRSAFEQYSINLRKVGEILIGLVSESLGLGIDYIKETLGRSEIMACNFYPPCPQPDLALGLPPHTDPGILTLLQQDGVGGLQVSHNEKWINVKPIPYAFITNVGDQIQFLSNGRYRSIEHRALINNTTPRVSIPYVLGPHWDSEVKPAQQVLDEDKTRPLYKPVVYSDFVDALQGGSLDTKKEYLKTLRY